MTKPSAPALAPAHVIDSRLFRDQFGTSQMRAIFSDKATLDRWIEAEAALARAQAKLGIIPQGAADAISSAAPDHRITPGQLREKIIAAGHPLVPAIKAFAAKCGDAGAYVHWGATTQDIMDTGLVLQLRDGLENIAGLLAGLGNAIAGQARAHADTVMAGRTHGQHAVPVTFGYKLAVWLDEIMRHQERLGQLGPRLLRGQLSGAAGTLATLGDQGAGVRRAMLEELGLGCPDISWHTARDGLCETISALAMISATCGKMANEVINLQRSEIGEVAEPAGKDAVGSSTMPQKRNPMRAQKVVSLARLTRDMPGRALDAMNHEHERDMAAWQAEWAFVPETYIYTSGALAQVTAIIEGLEVNRDRMRENLEAGGGFANAEAVMMALADTTGRQQAHDLVEAATKKALAGGTSFGDALNNSLEICAVLDRAQIIALLEPQAWLGEAQAAAERVLTKWEKDNG